MAMVSGLLSYDTFKSPLVVYLMNFVLTIILKSLEYLELFICIQ
jgi:hypothetical protein